MVAGQANGWPDDPLPEAIGGAGVIGVIITLLRWLLPSVGLRLRRHADLPSVVVITSLDGQRGVWLFDTATGSHS